MSFNAWRQLGTTRIRSNDYRLALDDDFGAILREQLLPAPDGPAGPEYAELAGTVAFSLSPSGALSGLARLAASSSLTFGSTAGLTGRANLAGTSALQLSPAGSLTGTALLQATTSITFTPAATLRGWTSMSGTSLLAFSTTAALSAQTGLAGSAAATFTPDASLTGITRLAGSSSLSFLTVGEMVQGGPFLNMSGTTTLSFSTSGGMFGVSQLSGSTDVAFSSVGGLSVLVGKRGGGGKFASGKHALGECDRCAASVGLLKLKPLTVDKLMTRFLVCAECWEEDHPQYRVRDLSPADTRTPRNPRPPRSFS